MCTSAFCFYTLHIYRKFSSLSIVFVMWALEGKKIIMLIIEVWNERKKNHRGGWKWQRKIENDCSSIFLSTPQIIEVVRVKKYKKSFTFDVLTWNFQQLTNIKVTQWIISQVKIAFKDEWEGGKSCESNFLCFINGYNYHSLNAINNKQCRET